ncbi:aminopeptidase P family protein [Micavibrio aeruginosavorus]|uniref:Metallopeptidase M24 family protein n=1 Tax=Micavibrio aeruginosavorus (strain ARL-13) TaxID=856793 RepID=G2KQB7_MICAA|nr:aminopeptidase P family protein [Micavibrio aeruginosavorus]AEP09053.1 metallopeptidase M24 family protein [Micavibrio aeruginosavorus ARL-13]
MSAPSSRLSDVRAHMVQEGIDLFLVPRADEFQGEYVPAGAERLSWLTGFTGSAGMAAVGTDKAVVVTDSRYELQVVDQTDAALFDTAIMDGKKTLGGTVAEWIAHNVKTGAVIGYDPKLHTPAQIKAFKDDLANHGVTFKAVSRNPLDAAWRDRPGMPMNNVEEFPEAIAGKSAAQKRDDIAAVVKKEKLHAMVITKPDSIAWLLNIRGTDVPHTPLALSYATIYDDGRVDWYIHPAKLTPPVLRPHLGNKVQIIDPIGLEHEMEKLARAAKAGKKAIGLDFARASIWFQQVLEGAGATVKDVTDPIIMPKAQKTPAEQHAIINAHIRDGVAVTRFLAWADRELHKGTYSELDVADRLEQFRRMAPEYRDSSFDTIAGWAENGAIVHYRATPEKFKQIDTPGILLLDSGAQYLDGTTDITRTITVGNPDPEVCANYTRVLRGHIAVSMARPTKKTLSADIDALARQPLKDAGLNYGHGTGHGVGCYLAVHEDGAGISSARKTPFMPGTLISNEPGYYKAGAYGIRIENLILTQKDSRGRMFFETVTLAPYDRRLIRADMMSKDELKWLNDYHAKVEQVIGPHLDATDRAWLKEACAPVKKPEAPRAQPARGAMPQP